MYKGVTDADMNARIGNPKQAFTSPKPTWSSKKISLNTKFKKRYNLNVKNKCTDRYIVQRVLSSDEYFSVLIVLFLIILKRKKTDFNTNDCINLCSQTRTRIISLENHVRAGDGISVPYGREYKHTLSILATHWSWNSWRPYDVTRNHQDPIKALLAGNLKNSNWFGEGKTKGAEYWIGNVRTRYTCRNVDAVEKSGI